MQMAEIAAQLPHTVGVALMPYLQHTRIHRPDEGHLYTGLRKFLLTVSATISGCIYMEAKEFHDSDCYFNLIMQK
jgi:hypothetical protein